MGNIYVLEGIFRPLMKLRGRSAVKGDGSKVSSVIRKGLI
jgi:hypothetical protein